MYRNRMLRRIFGPKKGEVTGRQKSLATHYLGDQILNDVMGMKVMKNAYEITVL
jgi:hypothetical protein